MKSPIVKFIASILAIFAPIQAMLTTVAVLIVSDLILGIWAAKKRREPITSAGFRRTINKLFIYEAALMLGFLAETYLSSALPICKLVGGVISLTEITSLFENLNTISGQNLLKSIMDKIKPSEDNKNES